MTPDRFTIGIGAAIMAVAITFLLPVSARRVNQNFVTIIIVVLSATAAFSLLDDMALALAVTVGASLAAIIYRDVARFVKHIIYDVTKYRRRDYWYRRVGQAVVGSRSRRRR